MVDDASNPGDGNTAEDGEAPDVTEPPVPEPPYQASLLRMWRDGAHPPQLVDVSPWQNVRGHLSEPPDDGDGGESEVVVVLEGVHAEAAIELAQALDVDPAFFDAHLGRTEYASSDPARWARAQHLQLDFPEVRSVSFAFDSDVCWSRLYLNEAAFTGDLIQPLSWDSGIAFKLPDDRSRDRLERTKNYAFFHRVSWWRTDAADRNCG